MRELEQENSSTPVSKFKVILLAKTEMLLQLGMSCCPKLRVIPLFMLSRILLPIILTTFEPKNSMAERLFAILFAFIATFWVEIK